ncbi:MAG: DUF2807 domain-containing protein [Flavobacteriales bacterium]|nr:DUF2807 domain-containing protein [Flavobacteriales bacterium]
MTGEGTDRTFELLRELPTEVSLETVGQLVAAFPLLPAAASWTNYINLNSIAMTSAGTLIIAGAAYLLSPTAPEPVALEPEPIVEVAMEAPVELDAVVWPGPAKKDPPKPEPVKEVTVAVVAEPEPEEVPEPSMPPGPKVTPSVVPAPKAVVVVPERKDPGPKAFDHTGFTGVSVLGGLDVMIEQGAFAVAVDGENVEDLVEITMQGKTLMVAPKERKGKEKGGCEKSPHIAVSMPALERLVLTGSGTIHVDEFVDMETMEIKLNGSGDVHFQRFAGLRKLEAYLSGSGDIHGGSVEVAGLTRLNLAGSGDISVHGSTEELDIYLVGSGDVDASGLRSGRCEIKIVGSGDAIVDCNGTFNSQVTGSGDLRNTGNAGRGGASGQEGNSY